MTRQTDPGALPASSLVYQLNYQNTMSAQAQHMTEKELGAEIARLENLMKLGEASAMQANRLDELRRNLARIRNVKHGRRGNW